MFESNHNVRWRTAGGTPVSSMGLTKPFTEGTTQLVEVELDDVLLRHHQWTGVSVTANNALHTALTTAVEAPYTL